MKPGKELDGLVAEKIMGWTYVRFPDGAMPKTKHWHDHTSKFVGPCPYYSTDIAAAFQVVEKLREHLHLVRMEDGRWLVGHDNTEGYITEGIVDMRLFRSAVADTLPHAICLAALRVVE